jgi:hypothetical protein
MNSQLFNMKKLIRILLRESLINERLMDVDDDVDFIYNAFFKMDIDDIKNTGIIKSNMFNKKEFGTDDLKSPLSQKANKINPCAIGINFGTNYYSPMNSQISMSINYDAFHFILDEFDGNLKKAIQELKLQGNKSMSINLSNEFSESKIKGSIHHELVHWVDDALHNDHIKKRANKASETGKGMTKKGLPINADKMEIQGQIHNVVQLKKEYYNTWDSLTFEDLLKLSTTLNVVYNQLKDDIKTKWKRDLLTRMHREGLLGKKMHINFNN